MNLDKSIEEDVFQQLSCLSDQYNELLKLLDEMEKLMQQTTTNKTLWTAFVKKRSKNRANKSL